MSTSLPITRAAASFLVVVSLLLAGCLPAVGVYSPDGQIEVRVSIDAEGHPDYALHYNGTSIVGWSRLGLEFVDGGPTDWEDIIALDSAIGEFVVIARRERGGDDAHWDDNPYAIAIERKDVTSDSKLELRLAAGGGTAVRFRRQEEATSE